MTNRKVILFYILLLTAVSCTTEQVTFFSPLENRQSLSDLRNEISTDVNRVNYMSELSDIVSYMPKFKNDKINRHIEKVKLDITEYVYAVREYNKVGEERYFDRLQADFKKLTKFKDLMSADEYEILMRYIVKVKSNISLLKSNQK